MSAEFLKSCMSQHPGASRSPGGFWLASTTSSLGEDWKVRRGTGTCWAGLCARKVLSWVFRSAPRSTSGRRTQRRATTTRSNVQPRRSFAAAPSRVSADLWRILDLTWAFRRSIAHRLHRNADFPKPGILFLDVMPILANPVAFEVRLPDALVRRTSTIRRNLTCVHPPVSSTSAPLLHSFADSHHRPPEPHHQRHPPCAPRKDQRPRRQDRHHRRPRRARVPLRPGPRAAVGCGVRPR